MSLKVPTIFTYLPNVYPIYKIQFYLTVTVVEDIFYIPPDHFRPFVLCNVGFFQ